MTKINHNRPLLRYLDNIRREMGIDARRTDTLSFGNSEPSKASDGIFPLTSPETTVTTSFFSSIENYLEVESTLLAAVAPSATKQSKASARLVSQVAAEGQLKGAATAYSAQMILSGLGGRMNLLNLYKRIEKTLKEDSFFLWEVINDVAMYEAIQKISALVEAHIRAIPPDA